MDKFWKWMEEKGYGHLRSDKIYGLSSSYNHKIPTKQMLIGYMIEYLIERKSEFKLPLFDSIEDIDYYLRQETGYLN